MSDETTPVTLDLLGRILRDIQADQRQQRAELREIRSLLLAQVEQGRRAERRMADFRDDLELMLKSELMGRLGHHETQTERILDDLVERVAILEAEVRKP